MAEESVFEKRHVEPNAMGDVEGLLEHFNLPPAVIKYVRKNKRTLQIVLASVLVLVVSFVLYDSYREKRMEKASSALSQALSKAGDEKEKALQGVMAEYPGTVSARWANVEMAHLEMGKAQFKEAADRYAAVRDDLKTADPLYALTIFGSAQALEASNEYDAASNAYQQLKDIKGYQVMGYIGMARIQEAQGKSDKALEILTEGLSALADRPQEDPDKRTIEDRISRLKVKQ